MLRQTVFVTHLPATAINLLFIHSFIRLDIRHIYSMTTVVMKDERMQILNKLMSHTRRPEYIQHTSTMLVGAVSLKGHYCMRNGL